VRRVLWTFWRRRVAELLKRASVVHAVSKREASILASHYPEARSKIVVIPNGVDEDVLSYRWQGQSSNYMVYAGRVEKYKRLELAVDVAKELNLKLLIIGKGPYREKLVRYANKVYRGGVEFLEPQPRQKYLELLSRARYAINPSKHEAFSIFTAEALAMGTPAIISKEIAENLEAQAKPFTKDLVIAENAPIRPWSEILQLYLGRLYS
jgi:glycosyltransferase involved in cell wall biosynthesis